MTDLCCFKSLSLWELKVSTVDTIDQWPRSSFPHFPGFLEVLPSLFALGKSVSSPSRNKAKQKTPGDKTENTVIKILF
jgi:hypothetical protein